MYRIQGLIGFEEMQIYLGFFRLQANIQSGNKRATCGFVFRANLGFDLGFGFGFEPKASSKIDVKIQVCFA